MTRNAVRNWFVVGSLVSLALLNALWPTGAAQLVVPGSNNVLDTFVARNIGPAKMGGRVTAIAGVDDQPNIVYAGTGTGGLWKTSDGGENWTPVFDNQSSVSIGDVAVCQSNPNIVWVGTGEHNPRNSVSWGDGVYKSVDGGKNWQHMGLRETHSIGRVVIDPKNPNIVYVAAMGHTWAPNKERGIFKTIDGGKTWEVSKFWDENTGAIELKMDPTDSNILYTAAWQVRRDAFAGGEPPIVFGPHAGLYKTIDGGKTWEKMTDGLPEGQVGRCGIDIYRKDPNVLYAIVNAKGKGGPGGGGGGGKGGGGKGGGSPSDDPNGGGTYRSDDKGKTWKILNNNMPRPMYFGQIRVDPNDDSRIYLCGVTMFVSNDGGKNYESRFTSGLGNPLNSPHADHHAWWINPKNSDEIYDGNDGGIWHSKDRAKTFQHFMSMPLGQYYGISCDMRKPYWVFGGCQDNGGFGTPSATTDPAGIRTNLVVYITGGDGFHTQNDPTDHNIVYSESQNGGLQRVDLSQKKGKGKGGIDVADDLPLDGQDQKKDDQKKDEKKKDDQTKDEPKKGDPKQEKKGGGFGGGKGPQIRPLGNNRWNWSTPMQLSPHDPWTFFCGSQTLYMSKERGLNPKAISPDLTYGPGASGFAYDGPAKAGDAPAGEEGKDKKDGQDKKEDKKDAQDKKDDEAKKEEQKKGGKGGGGFGGTGAHSLFTLAESPRKRGVIWTGSDDGRIMLTKDFGATWTDVSVIPGIPKERCISRVEPSHHADGTCYVSLTRYRNDDRKPYIFKTTDYGKTWENITNNLPESGSVHVVIESSRNKQLLFCGTEFALFASQDGGATWQRMKGGMPTVPVHDLVIHPRDRDLVVGTHGRSIFVFDDISPLEQMTPDVLAKPAHLFDVRPATAFKWKETGPAPKSNDFTGKNPVYGAIVRYYFKSVPAQPVSISIIEADTGKYVTALSGNTNAGLNEAVWNLRAANQTEGTVRPGEYLAVLQMGEQKQYKMIKVEAE
jgi:photosystem II stability/assembly factor-like uncharacterized protein